MIEWWNGMDLVGQIFSLVAIPSTLVLVVQTVLVLFGIGDDADADFDGAEDFIAGDDGFVLFSLRGIMAMAAIGGWSGLVMHEAGIALPVTIILAFAFGFMALVAIAFFMKLSVRLQSSGNLVLGYAVGKVGTVYIPIPAEMKGSGKVNLTVQERFVEVDAVTPASRKLTTGESVRIIATNEVGMVVVEPVNKD